MSEFFTDDDVTAAEAAVRETFHPEHALYRAGWDEKMGHVLSAVAESIWQRGFITGYSGGYDNGGGDALREAADEMNRSGLHPDEAEWLRGRADAMTQHPTTGEQRDHQCRGNDPTCPGHDGMLCHYEGAGAWPTPQQEDR